MGVIASVQGDPAMLGDSVRGGGGRWGPHWGPPHALPLMSFAQSANTPAASYTAWLSLKVSRDATAVYVTCCVCELQDGTTVHNRVDLLWQLDADASFNSSHAC